MNDSKSKSNYKNFLYFLLFIIAASLIWYFFIKEKEYENDLTEYNSFLQTADSLYEEGDYQGSITFYEKALENQPDSVFLKEKINDVQFIIDESNKEIQSLRAKALEREKNEDYTEALEIYRNILQLAPADPEALEKIDALTKFIQSEEYKRKAYARAMKRAQIFLENEEYIKAKNEYDKALLLKQSDSSAQEKLQELEEKLQTVRADSTFIEPSEVLKPTGTKMVLVKGGSFQMGGMKNEFDANPMHEVQLNSFYIGAFEVTQKDWVDVMGENPSKYAVCDYCPVESVSWNDAQEFIRRLNDKENENYRLPTEAEWEYAAKGGHDPEGYMYSGSDTLPEVGWYWDNAHKTQIVGSLLHNSLGIYDMSGNVWEMCSDFYAPSYYKRSSKLNPKGPKHGSKKVIRGGAFDYYEEACAVLNRNFIKPKQQKKSVGFRLAKNVE